MFRDLRGGKDGKRLGASPKKGRALLFFPAITASIEEDNESTTDEDNNGAFGNVYFDHTRADHRTTHAGEPPTVRMDKSILLSCGSIVVYILQWCLVGYCEMGLYII